MSTPKIDCMERGYVSRGQMKEHRRIYPDQWERYDFACRWIKRGDRVVDLACGSGFGTYLLSKATAKRALGLDISSQALDWARVEFGDTADFEKFDDNVLHRMAEKFDVAVSFETLEHMDEQAGKAFISNLRCLLRPGGMLILSTPLVESDSRFKPTNPFHVREYTWDELGVAISADFRVEARFCQVSRLARLRGVLGRGLKMSVMGGQDGRVETTRPEGIKAKAAAWLRQRPFWTAGIFVRRKTDFAGVQLVLSVRQ
jgi:cyclopropane fatty-acyl-phospholipid synthase-like methyltransferase